MRLPWRYVPIANGVQVNTSLTMAESKALAELARNARVLEVGSAYGYSSIVMAQTARHVLAVDPHYGPPTSLPASLEVMRDNLRSTGVEEDVSIVLATSEVFLPQLVSLGAAFDFIFIDGDHSEDAVRFDVEWARRLLHVSGRLAIHDYEEFSCPGVKRALDRLGSPMQLVDTLWIGR